MTPCGPIETAVDLQRVPIVDIAVRQRRTGLFVAFEPGFSHVEWFEDFCATQLRVTTPRHTFEQSTQQNVAGIRIYVLFADGPGGRAVCDRPFQNFLRCAKAHRVFADFGGPCLAQRKIPQPGRVIEQMRQRDRSTLRMHALDELRIEEVAERRRQRKRAALDPAHHEYCSENLGHTGDAKSVGRAYRLLRMACESTGTTLPTDRL